MLQRPFAQKKTDRIEKASIARLLLAALKMWREEGLRVLAIRTILWLKDERRYEGHDANVDTYDRFQWLYEPTQTDLARQRLEAKQADQPRLGVVTAVCEPSLALLNQTLNSLRGQTYQNWVWYVVDASANNFIWDYLTIKASQDSRIKLLRLAENEGLSANTNAALRSAQTDYVVILDQIDTLAPFALYSVASVIREFPETDFIYSDEDALDEHGKRCDPLFKPDWSPESLLCVNLLNRLSVFRRAWLDRVGYLDPAMEGAQDWDLYLRMSEHTQQIRHIPQVLYHKRQTTTSGCPDVEAVQKVQQKVLVGHLRRTGLVDPQVQFVGDQKNPHLSPVVTWQLSRPERISIIIPSRNNAQVLAACLNSLFSLTSYTNYEVIIVDTGSVEPATHQLYRTYANQGRLTLVHDEQPFNFSRACNLGARHAEGSLLLFHNNDTEIIYGDWLHLMAQWFERQGVGIVGVKLLYPDYTLQHAGVIVGFSGLADHLFVGKTENLWSVFGSDNWYRNLLAVTGACLMISRSLFDRLEGFDEHYKLNWSDVDLCLRAHEAGFRIIFTPHVRLIHHEGLTHRRHIPHSDFVFASQQWQTWFQNGDPYYNVNLTYQSNFPQFKRGRDDTPAEINRALMHRLPKKEILTLPQDLA